MIRLVSLIIAAGVVGSGCSPKAADPGIAPLANPAGETSRYPHLAVGADRSLWMSWLEDEPGGSVRVQVARYDDNAWSDPVTVAASTTLFDNWADTPAVTEISDTMVLVHWLARSGAGTYAYDVKMAVSRDAGANFGPAFTLHTDGTPTEHGFVSHYATELGFGAVWLDGRETGAGATHQHGHGSAGAMQLRYAEYTADGTRTAGGVLDERVCDCCQTDAARGSDRLYVAYRDRSLTEVRDIALAVRTPNTQTDGAGATWRNRGIAAADGWHIDGCPVNGPALAANGNALALAWYTVANDEPAIRIARSTDRGVSFFETALILSGTPLGRTDIVLLDDARLIVSWVEKTTSGRVAVFAQEYGVHGKPGPRIEVTELAADRSGGFPQMIRLGNRLVFAWTDSTGEQTAVRTGSIAVSALARKL